MSNRAWVTLATNDSYGLGALVLAHSLRRVNSAHPSVILITPSVTDAMRNRLSAVFAEVITVNVLDSQDATHLALLQRPELGITFTKIHCWSLTQYEKCVFLDADTLVVQNCDELFEREELSAAPDVGWPDCFNSGVFVFVPSSDTYTRLITFAQERGSFDGGDQGLLNAFFSDWAHGDINKHLPFLYNVTSAAFYSYLPALKHYGQNLKIIHFIGSAKPWLQRFNWESRSVDAPDHLRELLQQWWDIFVGQVHANLDSTMEPVETIVEDTEEGAPPVVPPQDLQYHYEVKVDPQSEFPWHHPDAQQSEPKSTAQVDESHFFDPWANYKAPTIYPSHQHENRYENERSSLKWGDQMKDSQSQEQIHQYYHDKLVYENVHQIAQEPSQQTQNYEYHRQKNTNNISHYHQPNHSTHTHNDHHSHNHTTRHEQTHLQNYGQQEERQDDKTHEFRNGYSKIHEHNAPYINRPTVEQVYHLHWDLKKRNRRSRRLKRIEHINKERMKTNGHISDTESEYEEDFRPRHPYDGFYLRHRGTIDSRGRKVCTHEIPPTPSPSPLPEEELPLALVGSSPKSQEDDEYLTASECEDQSGVAGNLARVVPGTAGSQSEALDELTRRQGWEAGNIDYMGADSFTNIWAKISQTLSQPPVKQPSPPRKEPSPPKQPSPPQEQSQPEVFKAAEAPVQEPIPAPVESKTIEPTPPTEIAAPAQPAPVLTETDKPVQESVPAPVEPKPVESTPPAEIAAPAQPASVQTEPIKPVEEPVPTPSPASVESKPVESTITKIAAPAQPAQSEPIKPVEEPVKLESVPPVDSAPEASKEKTEPAVPPTPPVTPKSTPEASTPVSETAPKLDAASEVQASAPVEAPTGAAEVPKVEETPKEVEAPKVAEITPVTTESPLPAAPEPASPAAPEPTSPAAPEAAKAETTPVKLDSSAATTTSTDSPPLANTPSKEEGPTSPAAESEERRKPVEKLHLSPPAVADPLPTPDSEAEDAATLAQSIIASELKVTSPSPSEPLSPQPPLEDKKLNVQKPELPTPPVSLAQIGVKPKGKPTTAAQIESSVLGKAEASAPATPGTPTSLSPATPGTPTTPTSPSEPSTPTEAPAKKKVVKKVIKKEGGGGSGGDASAPVPPPRKKEKKPKDK